MKFKNGDFARVKFGVPESCQDDGAVPCSGSYGRKLTITDVDASPCNTVKFARDDGGKDWCNGRHLEPWNDNEHWNGHSWAANPSCEPVPVIPDSVWVGGIEYVRKVDGATPKMTMAQEYVKWLIDVTEEECKVWDEEDNLKFTTKTISATADGDLVTIVERVVSME